MLSLFLWVIPRSPWSVQASRQTMIASLVVLLSAAVAPVVAVEGDGGAVAASKQPMLLAELGVALVPHDAAFLSSSLRLREQYDRIVKSNAFAAIKALPAVQRAIDSFEEQRSTPGSPFSTFDTFMQLPENEEAVEFLADMVATDTFVYGEPSCVAFWRLMRKLVESQQRAGLRDVGDGGRLTIEEDAIAKQEDEDDDEANDDDDDDDDEEDEDDDDQEMDFAVEADGSFDGGRQARLMLETLADNLDLLVVPDVVWGFKTTKRDVGIDQVKRLEVLSTLMLQADPDLAKAVERRKVAGGEVLTFTLDGQSLPLEDLEREVSATTGADELTNRVFARIRELDFVVAVGLVGDWVILSIGDSVDHLEKLAVPGSDKQGLLTLPAFKPLLEHADKPLTGISYISEPLSEAVSASRSDIQTMLAAVDQLGDSAELPEAAKIEIRGLASRAADGYDSLLPDPGPWMAFSFLAERGYEGYVWDWSRNQPFDGSRRLDLLEHVGGAPLGVYVSRIKSNPEACAAALDLAGSAWTLFGTYGRPQLNDEDREKFDAFAEHIAPLGAKASAVLTDKIMKGLADGQVGLVLDAKGRTKKLQAELPASPDPLPIVEPAIVLPLEDPKLFREGLSDLFTLADELTDAIREIDPDAVPEGYRIPEPEKAKADDGTIWSWKLVNSRLDEQVAPAIGVGEKAVVFSLVPKQAGRMLVENRLETGSQLTTFDEPLVAAAALDCAGLIDVLKPWVVYLTRYGCVQERDGSVDPDSELTAADENDQAKEVLEHVAVVLEACKSLRAAVAETGFRDDALVTRWRNVIRDMPAK
ncbi:MAG: hypothetical protein ACR2IT_09840 [Pirellulales bacterium]